MAFNLKTQIEGKKRRKKTKEGKVIMEKLKKFIVNLKVAGKLKAYRVTVLTMTVFLVAVALISTLVIRSNVKNITAVWSPAIGYIQQLETLTTEYRVKQYQHLVESDDDVMAACEKEIESIAGQITENCKALSEIINADADARKGQADYDKAIAAWEDYKSFSEEIIRLSTAGKQAEASDIMTGSAYEKYTSFRNVFSTLRDEFQVELGSSKQAANVCTVIIFIVISVAGIAIAVATTIIGRVITDSITEPVAQIDAAVASLRKGELSNVDMLTYESEDEFGDTVRNLKEAMNILSDYVREISEEITNIAEKVSSNAKDVEEASKSLSDGATEQAGVIEELNATIDTVVSLAADTAKETKSASERVKASASKANEEREKMNGLLTEMERITEISKEIGNIITDIEDIASQTNLLSLNASIESARAGEAGRGFAVVADQIGKLASDSAKSVINTRELIDKTLVEIEKGNTITRTMADAFNQIIADMESFAEMAQNTMEKANAQADSLEQIGQGIEQLSGVVQGTAASSEENTAISVNLADEAAKMQDRVNTFKLF